VAAVRAAQQAGFTNLSVDLMYGLPGQTLQDVADSIAQAQTLAVQHISIYGLQLEEGTVFARQESQGRLVLPADDETEAMYDYINEKLPQLGFARYEVSNFARPGKESRHNLGYWQDVP
jgi:oxygen-independent coproporphyrinogen-3 oxidase